MINQLLVRYLHETLKVARANPKAVNAISLLRDFKPWCTSQAPGAGPLAMKLPWITFGAIRYLRHRIRRNFKVFEFGAGGSTLFFHRNCAQVITCEHDRVWADKVRAALDAAGACGASLNVFEFAIDPDGNSKDPRKPEDYTSHSPPYQGMSFERYARSIDVYSDEYFDLILVDGRSRPSCVKHAIPKLAPRGLIVVDNAERPVYAAIGEMLKAPRFRRLNFYGPGPFNSYFWLTSIWERQQTGWAR